MFSETNLALHASMQLEEEEQLNLHVHALLSWPPWPCIPESAERAKAVEVVSDRNHAPSSLTGGQDVVELMEGLLP